MAYSVKGFRISDEVHQAVELRATLTRKSMGEVVEEILRQALRKELAMLANERAEGTEGASSSAQGTD